jgi:hypothetical protein
MTLSILAREKLAATVDLVTKAELDALADTLTIRIGLVIAAVLAVAVIGSHLLQ